MNELDKKMIIESLQEIISKLRDHDKMKTVSDLKLIDKLEERMHSYRKKLFTKEELDRLQEMFDK